MRLKRLLPLACAVAGAWSPTMSTPAASAFQHPSPNGRCHIGIQVAPRQITAGEPVVIFGRLVCRGRASAAGRIVRLYHHLLGTPGFSYVQSTTTDAQGFYQFQRADGAVETNRIWHVRSHGAESANRRIRVAAQVTLSGPPEGTQILTGAANRMTFTGTVSPADIGARVILQRQNALTGNEWRRIDSGRVEPGPNSTGSFSIVHRFLVPGDANIRVLVRSQERNIASPSNVLTYEISQAQNPALTINASADPIAFGQPVTISGVLAGGAHTTVTLLARTVHQRGFAPVAQALTDAGGNYSFPAQSPVNSTFYEVQGSGSSCPPNAVCAQPQLCQAGGRCGGPLTTSAVLYEAVKYVLTAQVSPTSVLAGQTLTFTGTVAPSSPGHVIYLERQNASSQEFHVVRVSTVSPTSTFSIPYQVFSTGTLVFRVYIPGGPDNAAAASQQFSIPVGPAPAGSLTGEAPGNSSAPPEGSSSPSEGEREGEERNGGAGESEPPHGKHHR